MKTMKYRVTAPVTNPREAAARLGSLTMIGMPAGKAVHIARELRWSFSNRRKAERFARRIPGAVVAINE